MPDIEYVKDYREKELRQYVLAYLLIAIASVGFQTVAAIKMQTSVSESSMITSIIQMIMTDIFLGAICVLVIIFNEIWPDRAKIKLVYWKMPSDTVFSRIANGRIDANGFDLNNARESYAHLASASAAKQTSEWGILLRKCREAGRSNVADVHRLQLMTCDICLSTFSLLIMNIFAIVNSCIYTSLRMLGLPIVYLLIMLIVTRAAARNRAHRLVNLVIKNAVQDNIENQAHNER